MVSQTTLRRLNSRSLHQDSKLSDDPIVVQPWDRYAFIAKTRAGKSFATIILLSILLPWKWPTKERLPWQVWWIETKCVNADIRRLRKWGFRRPSEVDENRWPRLLFVVKPIDTHDELSVAHQVQAIAWKAARRGNVIVVIDEYVSCVMSARAMGAGLKNLAQRGGGLHVGLIGGTQEPVGIPRQLVSQATHAFLGHVTYTHDVAWCQELCPIYPDTGPPHRHGFYYRWLDGPPGSKASQWMYYRDIFAFVEQQRKEQLA